MKTIINMSHPLSEKVIEQIEAVVLDDVKIVTIAVQIDLGGNVMAQLDAIVDSVPYPYDILFPPSLALAAGYITARLSYAQSDAMLPVPPRLGWLKRSGPLGNEWELGGIIY